MFVSMSRYICLYILMSHSFYLVVFISFSSNLKLPNLLLFALRPSSIKTVLANVLVSFKEHVSKFMNLGSIYRDGFPSEILLSVLV